MKELFLVRLSEANVFDDDWAYDLIDGILDDYSRGRMSSYLARYNSNGGAMNEDLRCEIAEWTDEFEWSDGGLSVVAANHAAAGKSTIGVIGHVEPLHTKLPDIKITRDMPIVKMLFDPKCGQELRRERRASERKLNKNG